MNTNDLKFYPDENEDPGCLTTKKDILGLTYNVTRNKIIIRSQ